MLTWEHHLQLPLIRLFITHSWSRSSTQLPTKFYIIPTCYIYFSLLNILTSSCWTYWYSLLLIEHTHFFLLNILVLTSPYWTYFLLNILVLTSPYWTYFFLLNIFTSPYWTYSLLLTEHTHFSFWTYSILLIEHTHFSLLNILISPYRTYPLLWTYSLLLIEFMYAKGDRTLPILEPRVKNGKSMGSGQFVQIKTWFTFGSNVHKHNEVLGQMIQILFNAY